jgi:hypothetical protein
LGALAVVLVSVSLAAVFLSSFCLMELFACVRRYNVSVVSGRATSTLIALVCIICAVFAEMRWCRVLIAAMFGDFVFRFFMEERSSFLGTLGDIVGEFFPLKFEAGPPRQVRLLFVTRETALSFRSMLFYLGTISLQSSVYSASLFRARCYDSCQNW